MGLKDIKAFTKDEVGLWFTAQSIDPTTVIAEGVDGDLLLSLSADDLKADLGLSGLQAKKVMKNIEFSKCLTQPGGKEISAWSAEEVGMWMASQNLDPTKVVSEGVDGTLLLQLSADDWKNDLGLSNLRAKKVMMNIEYSKSLASASATDDAPEDVPDDVQVVMEEMAVLEDNGEEEIVEERAVEENEEEEVVEEEERAVEEEEPIVEEESPVEEEGKCLSIVNASSHEMFTYVPLTNNCIGLIISHTISISKRRSLLSKKRAQKRRLKMRNLSKNLLKVRYKYMRMIAIWWTGIIH